MTERGGRRWERGGEKKTYMIPHPSLIHYNAYILHDYNS
jgi:hypothetical protein